MKTKFVVSLLTSTLFAPGLANAACLAGVPAYLCASYDFNLPVNIASTAGPIPAFTVMGGDVGIGTLAPDSPLTVAGTVHLTSGAIQFPDGTVQSTSATGSGLGSQWSSAGFDISYSVGNVGVGTASPDSPLTVAGLIHTTSGGIKFPDGSIQTVAATSAAPSQWTTSGANIYYTSSAPGNVGIGTSSPAQKLSVAGIIESTTGGVKFPDGTVQTTAGGGGSSQWQTNTNGISYSGNVGLGTTNPSSALAIVNAGTSMGSGVFYNFLQRSPGAFGTLLGYDSTNSAGVIASSSTTPGGLEFLTYSGSFQKRMRITAAGDVGIGTLTPASKLSVAGVVESTTGGFKFPDGTTQTTAASGSGGSSQWTTAGTDISYSAGAVGIGTTTPDSPLTVAGLIHTTFGGIQFPDGTVQASAAYNVAPQWTPTGTGSDVSYSAGNVGIGTTSPNGRLDVQGSGNTSGTYGFGVRNSASNYSFVVRDDGNIGIGTISPNGRLDVQGSGSTASTYGFGVRNSASTYNFVVRDDGNVGVGTTAPNRTLTVAGIIRSTIGGIEFPDGTVQTTAAVGGGGSSQWTTAGSNISYTAGAVGVGTSTPDQPLTVAGIIRTTTGGIQFPDGSIQTIAASTPVTYWESFGGNVFYNPIVPGNLGVGTSTPGRKLSVNGHIESMSGGFVFPDGSIQSTAYTGTGLSQWTNYTGGIAYSAGTVGIGTTAPVGTLDVFQPGINVSGTFNSNVAQENYSSIGTHLGNDTASLTGVLASSSASSGLSLGTTSGTYQERIRITNSGNVGVGTSSPSSRLTVAGVIESSTGGFKFPDGSVQLTAAAGGGADVWETAGNDIYYMAGRVGIGTATPERALHLTKIGTDESKSGILFTDDSSGNYRTSIIPNFAAGNAFNNKLQFLVSDGSTSGQQASLVLTGAGTAGIGTSSPLRALHIVKVGSDETRSGITFTNDASGNYRSDIIPNFSAGSAANNKLQFLVSNGTATGQTVAMILSGSGDVGIGTSTPSYKLDVTGTMRAYGITDASDVRLKKNISPLSHELEKILKLVAVTYNWKDARQDVGSQIGLIAQDVEKVYPELVKTDNRGMKSVNYSHLVAPLAQAVKELSAQNTELMARLERLEKKMESK